jgi:hypothetical protein
MACRSKGSMPTPNGRVKIKFHHWNRSQNRITSSSASQQIIFYFPYYGRVIVFSVSKVMPGQPFMRILLSWGGERASCQILHFLHSKKLSRNSGRRGNPRACSESRAKGIGGVIYPKGLVLEIDKTLQEKHHEHAGTGDIPHSCCLGVVYPALYNWRKGRFPFWPMY